MACTCNMQSLAFYIYSYTMFQINEGLNIITFVKLNSLDALFTKVKWKINTFLCDWLLLLNNELCASKQEVWLSILWKNLLYVNLYTRNFWCWKLHAFNYCHVYFFNTVLRDTFAICVGDPREQRLFRSFLETCWMRWLLLIYCRLRILSSLHSQLLA